MTAMFAGAVIAAPLSSPAVSLWALTVAGAVSGWNSFD
jgi:hypothetical protein